MKKNLSIIALGVTILILVGSMIVGCGQQTTSNEGSPSNENLSITQEVKITKYNGTSVASTESLTLSSSPQSLEFTIFSNYLVEITVAQITINYAAFSDVSLQDDNSKFIINNPAFGEGQNPISVNIIYSTGQSEIDHLKVIIASI